MDQAYTEKRDKLGDKVPNRQGSNSNKKNDPKRDGSAQRASGRPKLNDYKFSDAAKKSKSPNVVQTSDDMGVT